MRQVSPLPRRQLFRFQSHTAVWGNPSGSSSLGSSSSHARMSSGLATAAGNGSRQLLATPATVAQVLRLVSVAFSALLIQFHLNAPELNEKIACGGRPVGFATASLSTTALTPTLKLRQVLDCWQPIWRPVLKCLCCR